MKQCTKCFKTKPHSDFHKKKQINDGYAYHCKLCVKAYDMKEHDATRVLPRKLQGALVHCRYCKTYLDRSNFSKNLTYCNACSKLVGHSGNLKKYGLSMDDYMDLEESQNKLCAICNKQEQSRKRLSVDHDHSCCPGVTSCGKCIRGLICFRCNTALGMVEDSKETLQSMIKYLSK